MNSSMFVYLCSLVSVLGLVILVFWLYRQLVLDRFRQNLFSLRDSLFDEARKGNIDFESDAYQALRQTMNGLIRFGHRMNMPNTILLLTLNAGHIGVVNKVFADRLDEAMRALPAQQRKLISGYRTKMNFETMEYLLLSSPLFNLSLVMPLVIIATFHVSASSASRVVRVARMPLDRVDSLAYASAKG